MKRTIILFGCVMTLAAAAQATYFDVVTNNHPIGFWRLNESSGTTAADSSDSHTATYLNSPTKPVPGIPASYPSGTNTAVSFNGVNQYARVGADDHTGDPAFTPNGGANWTANQGWSVELWLKTSVTPTDNKLPFAWYAGNTDTYLIFVLTDGTPEGYVRDGSGTGPGHGAGVIGPTPVTDGKFHQLVLTFGHDAGNLPFRRLYVDGSLAASDTSTALTALTDPEPVDIGGAPLAANTSFINGVIDEVSVYGTALSDADIRLHYTSGVDIPEPSSVALLALGGLLLWRARRRSRME